MIEVKKYKILLLLYPLDALARGSLDLGGFLTFGLAILGIFLLYHFWIFILIFPYLLFTWKLTALKKGN